MEKITIKKTLVFLCFLITNFNVFAQNTVENNAASATVLKDKIAGNGINITNPRINLGAAQQFGTFNNGISNANLQINTGILLTTGDVPESFTSNNQTNYSEVNFDDAQAPDSDLAAIDPDAKYDTAVFEFEFTSDGEGIGIQYQFASDEYPEYVCTRFNDAFGFFISGGDLTETINIATLPNGNIVAVNSVNNGSPGTAAATNLNTCDLTQSEFHMENSDGSITIEYDGISTRLFSTIRLTQGVTYTLKMALADVGDATFDSGVFVEVVRAIYDSDNDGILDTDESGNQDPNTDADNDGVPLYLDDDDFDNSVGNDDGQIEPGFDADNDGIANHLDTDADNDGIDDNVEGDSDFDGDGIPNFFDLDSDNDGIPDSQETAVDFDNDNQPNYLDLDSDNDGIYDVVEAGGTDADANGELDNFADSNNNGLNDNVDSECFEAGANATAVTNVNGVQNPNNAIGSDNQYAILDTNLEFITLDLGVVRPAGTVVVLEAGRTGLTSAADIMNVFQSNNPTGGPFANTGPFTFPQPNIDYRNNYTLNAATRYIGIQYSKNAVTSDGNLRIDNISYAARSICNGLGGPPLPLTNSDSEGNPDYLDADSDNDGCGDADEAYFGSTNNPDTDNNGFYGSGRPATDNKGKVTVASYAAPNSLYINAAQNSCDNTDNDEVPDISDLDMDNDGILNSDEEVITNELNCGNSTPLNFNANPVEISGDNDGVFEEGEKFRFTNVTSGVDAIITISNLVNATVNTLDDNATDANSFKPVNDYTLTNNNQQAYVEYLIEFVNSGTEDLVAIDQFAINFNDIDGTAQLREQNWTNYPTSYTYDNPTSLDFTNSDLLIATGTVSPSVSIESSKPLQISSSLATPSLSSSHLGDVTEAL